MAEPSTAPTSETPVTPPAGDQPPVDKGGVGSREKSSAASRRAAAMADLPETSDGFVEATPEQPSGEPKVEAKPTEPPKEEPKPDLALQARAQADRYLQGERKKLEDERAAFAKERTEWEASSKQAGDDAAKVHRMVSADIVEYADQQKWTAKQRYEMAQALGWSSQPEEKRPAGWRGNGTGQVMSEVEQLRAELAKTKGEIGSWKEQQEKARQEAEERAQDDSLGGEVLQAMPADGGTMRYAKAFVDHSPEVAKRDLAKVAKEMIAAEKETAGREYREPKMITAADVLAEYDKRWKAHLDRQYGWAAKLYAPAGTPPPVPAKGAPAVPPARATASPTAPNGRSSREERRRAALESIED